MKESKREKTHPVALAGFLLSSMALAFLAASFAMDDAEIPQAAISLIAIVMLVSIVCGGCCSLAGLFISKRKLLPAVGFLIALGIVAYIAWVAYVFFNSPSPPLSSHPGELGN